MLWLLGREMGGWLWPLFREVTEPVRAEALPDGESTSCSSFLRL